MNLDLKTFKANVKSIARPSLFYVEMASPPITAANLTSTEMAFTCKIAQIPADDIQDLPVPFMGRVIHFNGNRQTQTSIQMTLFAASAGTGNSWEIYRKFLAWHEAINAQEANIAKTIVMEELKSDAAIHLMNANGSSDSFLVKAIGCYPSSIGAVTLDWNQNQTADYQITLQYDYLQYGNTGSAYTSLNAALSSL
jgi:hypothetical protein